MNLPEGNSYVAFIGVVAMLFIAFATITDVILRWLFSSPIDGLSEIEKPKRLLSAAPPEVLKCESNGRQASKAYSFRQQ